MSNDTRKEKDSMGEIAIPKDALWGPQTERAVENFPISGLRMPRSFIRALGLIKAAAAKANMDLSLLDPSIATAIIDAAEGVAEGHYDDHFPVDVFQTGSGTSTNMNCNEVIAHLAKLRGNIEAHANDDVNMCQSSNDVIPTAIHLSASLDIHENLIPALQHLRTVIDHHAKGLDTIVKTGRTHLMDALPLTFAQEMSAWSSQIQHNLDRITATFPRLHALALGATAIGTGLNAEPSFGNRVCVLLSQKVGITFKQQTNLFEAIACLDTIVELSGELKTLAVSLMKISNDLRLMNSGPLSGLAEIALPALQPGSSIMPGKVNPVIAESACMVCAQVIGNDTAISIGGAAGNFQLNTMMPMIAYNILLSIKILSNTARNLADKAIAGFTVNKDNIKKKLLENPILVTALNSVIGYEKGAAIAKRAYKEGKTILEVAKEMTDLSESELEQLLDPMELTKGGIKK